MRRGRASAPVHTVPWHPELTEVPGWLLFALQAAACCIRDEGGGYLPHTETLRRGVNRHLAASQYAAETGELDDVMTRGLVGLLIDFEFIARVGGAGPVGNA